MKITGPLHSDLARGTIADVLTFSHHKNLSIARYQRKQKDKLTAGRILQREKFKNATASCRFLEYGQGIFGVASYGVDWLYWNELANGKVKSGYNVCVSDFLKNN